MIYNGRNFSEFGVHVDESKAFGSPEKDYELIEVVGRNGSLAINNDRFKDIVLSFPCFIRSGFIEKYRDLLAYLNSVDGYQRLETEKEPNHFRKALFTGSVEVQTTPWNQGGFFTINFTCLPQRFLKSGETTTSVSSSSSSVSGNPVSISNPSGLTSLTGLSVDIQPVQSGEGDPSPTNIRPIVAANGKNLYPIKIGRDTWGDNASGTHSTDNDVLTVTATTAASSGVYSTGSSQFAALTPTLAGTYSYSLSAKASANGSYILGFYGAGRETKAVTTQWQRFTFTGTFDGTGKTFNIYGTGTAGTIEIKDFMLETGSSASAYQPYQGIMVERTGKNLLPDSEYTTNATGATSHTVNATGKIPKGTIITISGDAEGTALDYSTCQIQWRIGSTVVASKSPNTTTTFADDVIYNNLMYYTTGTLAGKNVKLQAELGSTATAYEPYIGTSYPYTLGQNVYGGSVDLATGVLTVTHQIYTVSSVDSLVTKTGFIRVRTANPTTAFISNTNEKNAITNNMVFNYAGVIGFNGNPSVPFSFYVSGGYTYFVLPTSAATDLETANAWFTNNQTTVVYPLATPTTVQLTPQQVSLLTGTNIISTDMNSLTVTLSNPSELENPTLFESKPIIRVYGNGTLNVNDQYITVANSPYTYIDIDCELMDCYHGSNNANQYVSFSTTDYVTLRSGTNYFSYSGFTKVEVTPRWFEV